PLEDRDRLFQRCPGCSSLLLAALNRSQHEKAASPLEGLGDALVLLQRVLERSVSALQIPPRSKQDAATAPTGGKRPRTCARAAAPHRRAAGPRAAVAPRRGAERLDPVGDKTGPPRPPDPRRSRCLDEWT